MGIYASCVFGTRRPSAYIGSIFGKWHEDERRSYRVRTSYIVTRSPSTSLGATHDPEKTRTDITAEYLYPYPIISYYILPPNLLFAGPPDDLDLINTSNALFKTGKKHIYTYIIHSQTIQVRLQCIEDTLLREFISFISFQRNFYKYIWKQKKF